MSEKTSRATDQCTGIEYWGLSLLKNGAAELCATQSFSLGSVLHLQLVLQGGSSAEIKAMVVDCVENVESCGCRLTLLLLDEEGIPVCQGQGYRRDLELSA